MLVCENPDELNPGVAVPTLPEPRRHARLYYAYVHLLVGVQCRHFNVLAQRRGRNDRLRIHSHESTSAVTIELNYLKNREDRLDNFVATPK